MSEIIEDGTALGKAQKRIFRAFLELSGVKSIDKITVSELCERADVNRSTFYRYYYDIYDLQSKMQDYSIGSVLNFCSGLDFGLSEEHNGTALLNDEMPRYEDELSVAILKRSVHDISIAKKMFERLMRTIPPFLKFANIEFSEQISDVLRFILNGAIFYCVDNADCFDIQRFYEIAKISVYTFKFFIDTVRYKGEVETVFTDDSIHQSPQKKKERLSVMKTKRSLKRAFSELSREKSANKITVSELCQKAEVSHSTFYNHFSGIDDFVNSVKDEIVGSFLNISEKVYESRGNNTIGAKELLNFIEKNQKFIVGLKNNIGFSDRLFKFPKQFAGSFYKIIDSSYDCKFDKRTSFYFVCYSAWTSLFQSFDEENMSGVQALNIAYSMFMNIFTSKQLTD